MILHQHRRAGLTLTESLVALFIMAFGILSLMTLFPLGAIRMGQSLRDDRMAQCAWQADGITRMWWQTEVAEKTAGSESLFWKTLDTGTGAGTPIAADSSAPSYVVALDPMGYSTRSGAAFGNSGPGTSQIPRRTSELFLPPTIPAAAAALAQVAAKRTCTLVDDMAFDNTGVPDRPAGNVMRQGNYSWCVLIQRPSNRDRYTVNLKVLVFDRRRPDLNTTREQVYTTGLTANANANVITLVSGTQPALKKGGWVMDGTNGQRMDFYRVKSFTDSGTGTYQIELDTPLKNTCTSLYIFEKLEEVFDRPQLMAPTYSNPQP